MIGLGIISEEASHGCKWWQEYGQGFECGGCPAGVICPAVCRETYGCRMRPVFVLGSALVGLYALWRVFK